MTTLKQPISINLIENIKKAYNTGKSASIAVAFNVCSLFWINTINNYQFRNGTSCIDTFKTLYK